MGPASYFRAYPYCPEEAANPTVSSLLTSDGLTQEQRHPLAFLACRVGSRWEGAVLWIPPFSMFWLPPTCQCSPGSDTDGHVYSVASHAFGSCSEGQEEEDRVTAYLLKNLYAPIYASYTHAPTLTQPKYQFAPSAISTSPRSHVGLGSNYTLMKRHTEVRLYGHYLVAQPGARLASADEISMIGYCANIFPWVLFYARCLWRSKPVGAGRHFFCPFAPKIPLYAAKELGLF